MKLDAEILGQILVLSPKHRGVFTIHDLMNLFLATRPVELQQKIKPFLKSGVLFRFCRGFYVTKDFDLETLSQKISPGSAISFGSVLAKELLIGSVPQKCVYAAKVGTSRVYNSQLGRVVHLGFSESLWFGYSKWRRFVRYADKEKAFLDTLYFYQRGYKFSFNVYSDIQIDRLNLKVLESYLKRYKNRRFRKFVEGILHGKHKIR